jgi:hypothetical protein
MVRDLHGSAAPPASRTWILKTTGFETSLKKAKELA